MCDHDGRSTGSEGVSCGFTQSPRSILPLLLRCLLLYLFPHRTTTYVLIVRLFILSEFYSRYEKDLQAFNCDTDRVRSQQCDSSGGVYGGNVEKVLWLQQSTMNHYETMEGTI